ncbi:MAG: ISAzo13 family transposase, partial [Planctomycetaceae bacterium]|nr:ISAzo13 family transposase [Planctomycetaceae bacterium]
DFPIKEPGKATPFGVYHIYKNQGFVNVGLSSDTAAFAVESIRRWWYAEGILEYSHSEKIVLTADGGGSNGSQNRLWKLELQKLARYSADQCLDHRQLNRCNKNRKRLSIRCVLDENEYKGGIVVSDKEFESINILKCEFHGEWNYTIRRNPV